MFSNYKTLDALSCSLSRLCSCHFLGLSPARLDNSNKPSDTPNMLQKLQIACPLWGQRNNLPCLPPAHQQHQMIKKRHRSNCKIFQFTLEGLISPRPYQHVYGIRPSSSGGKSCKIPACTWASKNMCFRNRTTVFHFSFPCFCVGFNS